MPYKEVKHLKKHEVVIIMLFVALLSSLAYNATYVEKVMKKQKSIDYEFVSDLKDLSAVINNKDIDSTEFLRQVSVFSGKLSTLASKTTYVNENNDLGASMRSLEYLLDRPGIERQYENLRKLSKYIDNVLKNPRDNKATADLLKYLHQVEEKLFQTQFG